MKKHILFALGLLGFLSIQSVWAWDFTIQTNLTKQQQETYRQQLDSSYKAFYKNVFWLDKEVQKQRINTILSKIDKLSGAKLSDKNRFILGYVQFLLKNRLDTLNINISCASAMIQALFRPKNDNGICKVENGKNYVSFSGNTFWPFDGLDGEHVYSSGSNYGFRYTNDGKDYVNINGKVFWPYVWLLSFDFQKAFKMDEENYAFWYENSIDYKNPTYYIKANWIDYWPFDGSPKAITLNGGKYSFVYGKNNGTQYYDWYRNINGIAYWPYTNLGDDITWSGENYGFSYGVKNGDSYEYYVNINGKSFWPYINDHTVPYILWHAVFNFTISGTNYWFYFPKAWKYHLIVNWEDKWAFYDGWDYNTKKPINLSDYLK